MLWFFPASSDGPVDPSVEDEFFDGQPVDADIDPGLFLRDCCVFFNDRPSSVVVLVSDVVLFFYRCSAAW